MNGTSEKSLEGEYIFTNGKWTIVLKPVRVAGNGYPVSRQEMTADQVRKGMPDDLLSTDTCPLQPSPAEEPSEKNSHALDQSGQVSPNTLITTSVRSLNNTAEIQATSTQEGTESGHVLDLALVQPFLTVSMETSKFNTSEGADVAFMNCDLGEVAQADTGNDGASISGTFPQIGQTVPKDGNFTVKSQPTSNPKIEISDLSENINVAKGIVEPVVPGNVMSHDVKDERGPECIPESQSLSKTALAGLPLITELCDDAAETGAQNNFEQSSLNLISTNQETKVPENSQGENIAPTFRAISDKNNPMQTQDQSSTEYSNRISSAVGDIPDTHFEIDWIGETPQGAVARVDTVAQGETVRNTDTERGDVIYTGPEIGGIVGETVRNTNTEISGTVQDTICHADSEIDDFTKKPSCSIDPEVGGIVEEMVSCISSAITDIIHEFSSESIIRNNAGDISCQTDSEKSSTTVATILGETVSQADSERRVIKGETTYNAYSEANSTIGAIRSETACDTGSDIGFICGDTVCNIDPEISSVVSKAVPNNNSVEETVPAADIEIRGMIREAILNHDSEVRDSIIHDPSVDISGTNDGNHVPKFQVLQEPLYKLAVKLNKPDTENTTPVQNQSSIPPNSAEPNNLEYSDSILLLNQTISNPNSTSGGSLIDSTSNLLENVLTQTKQNLVTESKLEMATTESFVLEDPVPDRIPHFSTLTLNQMESMVSRINEPVTENNMTKNNSDTHLLMPDFLHTSVETSQINKEAETDLPLPDLCHTPAIAQDLDLSCRGMEEDCSEMTDAKYSNELSNELWLDACQFLVPEEDRGSIFDEWGHSPAPSPPKVSPDNTKPLAYSQGRGAMIGQLVGDWELPILESWSSSDSWASALSDWFQSVTVFPEDSPLVAIKTSCSDPTDVQTQPCMAIQDTTEEPKDSSKGPSTTGQICPSPSLMEAGVDTQSRKVPKDENTKEPVLQPADKDMHHHSQLSTAETQDLPGDSVGTQIEKKIEVETVNLSGSYMPNLASQLQEEIVVPVLPVKERTAGKLESQPISTKDVWKVTENRTSHTSPDFEEENVRNYGPLRFSGYPNNKDPTAGCVCSPCLDACSPQLPSDPEHLTHTESVDTDCLSTSRTPCHADRSWTHVGFNIQDPETTQKQQGRAEDPVFIMPFAPISTGTSFHHLYDLKEDQLSPQTSSKPSLIGITGALTVDHTGCLPAKSGEKVSGEESSHDQFHTCSEKNCERSSPSEGTSSQETENKTETQKASDISRELSKLTLLTGQRFMVSEEKRVAYVTLDLDDILNFNKETNVGGDQGVLSCLKQHSCEEQLHIKVAEMPHNTTKSSTEGKTRSKHKENTTQQLGTATKKQEKVELHAEAENKPQSSADSTVTVIETIVITEKVMPKSQGKKKKKKKHGLPKQEDEHPAEVGNGARPKATKAKSEEHVASLTPKLGRVQEKPALPVISTINTVSTVSPPKTSGLKQHEETEAIKDNAAKAASCSQESQSTLSIMDDDLVKRRRISEEKNTAVPIRMRPQLPAIFRQKKEEEVVFKRAYSDVVKQKVETPKDVVVPTVVAEIQAVPVPDDPQSISLWCQFSPVAAGSTIAWTKDGKVLSENKRGVCDDSRVTLSILKACSKDLGMYRCCVTSSFGSVSTSEYHLTSEVLMELVIPSHDTPVECRKVEGEEEDVHCAPLLFRDNILTDQYFGENQPASIVTEKDHFGEGMHRKAFRTTLRAGMVPTFNPGHPCVLKVHNAISCGTKNNEELVGKNYNLAVEECYVQNTAREYIRAYTNAAKSTESFGEVPEIIPIYLVHRPSNDIPYATLEEELIGDFVKYSVKDGKEINLMRRDSEAGQKCCAFQHWVYTQTDGNLLVTDMQGVGMKLTDVGIATCKKGYKGFKGNCSTSFIDQFKALHQCNRFCEILGLTSLQPKPKRTVAPPKPKAQPVPKKKTFGPVLKGKS